MERAAADRRRRLRAAESAVARGIVQRLHLRLVDATDDVFEGTLHLLALGNVIASLCDETRQEGGRRRHREPLHVPYRESKLTRLLQVSPAPR